MSNLAQIMEQIEATGAMRPVKSVPLQMPNGIEVPKKAIIYADNGQYISTVGTGYELIQNDVAYENLAKSLLRSNLDLNGLEVKASASKTNARTILNFVLPEHNLDMGGNDVTALQIVTRNSYDASWKFSVDVGGFRMLCTNGQVIGNFSTAYKNMHTSGFDFTRMRQHLDMSAEVFAKMGKQWMSMRGIQITKRQALDMTLDYLNKHCTTDAEKLELLNNLRSRGVQEMRKLWNKYSIEMGSNMFALYNAMTDHATHVRGNGSIADIQTRRQGQVVKTVEKWLPALQVAA